MIKQRHDSHLDDTLDVSVTLGVVDGPELGGSLAMLVVGLEDSSGSFTLDADSTSHLTLQRNNYFQFSKYVRH